MKRRDACDSLHTSKCMPGVRLPTKACSAVPAANLPASGKRRSKSDRNESRRFLKSSKHGAVPNLEESWRQEGHVSVFFFAAGRARAAAGGAAPAAPACC